MPRRLSRPRISEGGVGTGAGLDFRDEPGSHGGLGDVVVAGSLAGQLVQGFHLDGVWRPGGRLQFGAAGNAFRHYCHLRMI